MRVKSTFILVFLSLCVVSPSMASNLKSRIGRDRVTIADGKMKIEEYSLCNVKVPGATKPSFQMRNYAEAPLNAGISRDFLVSFDSTMTTVVIVSIGTSVAKGSTLDGIKALDCSPISAPIGKVDMELNLYLTADGYQMAVVDGSTGKTTQSSQLWDEK